MKKILIIKSDRIGDLINISSFFKNLKLNFRNSEITLVCSKYNSQIVKYYPEISNIIIFENSLLKIFFKYFKNIFIDKYDFFFQLDGKKKSYYIGIFVRAKFKSCLLYLKKKTVLNYSYFIKRPNTFLSLFYDYLVQCNEEFINETNKKFHYLSLYLSILKRVNLKIITKNHHLSFNGKINQIFTNFFHIHIDERWVKFDKNFYKNFLTILDKRKLSIKLYITSNIQGNSFFYNLKNDLQNKDNVRFNDNASIDELINIIYNSHTSISNHTGLTVHVAACFKKRIVDIVSSNLDLHYDRWIPNKTDYSRYNFKNFFTTFTFN